MHKSHSVFPLLPPLRRTPFPPTVSFPLWLVMLLPLKRCFDSPACEGDRQDARKLPKDDGGGGEDNETMEAAKGKSLTSLRREK